MHRNPIFRRLVVATVMFLALFTQFQMLFACEKTEGQAKPMCCCDEPGDMSKGCAQGSGCLDDAGIVPNFTDCCEISYAPVTQATDTTPGATTQQITLLDGPQPPPPHTAIVEPEFLPALSSTTQFNTLSVLQKTSTYQKTNRYRI